MIELVIEHLRYTGLFVLLVAAGLGVPVPEEVPIVAAGVLSHAGIFRWWIALPVCLAGVLLGDTLLYWVGHHWGAVVLDWGPVRRVVSRERATRLLAAYRDRGVTIVFGARHLMGLRAAAFLTAGIARIPFWKFLAVDAGAALVGVPASFGLAFAFADRVERVVADVRRVEHWLGLAAVVAVVVWFGVRAWRGGRRA